MSPALAGLAAVALLLAARELWAERGEGAVRRLSGLAGSIPVARLGSDALSLRIERAGLRGRLDPRAVRLARLGVALGALPAALAASAAAPGRSAALTVTAVATAAALVPDLVLRRLALARARRLERSLPAALDLIAKGAAAGRSPRALIAEAGAASRGPLAEELGLAVAALDCGRSEATVFAELGRRAPALGAVARLLERSSRLGTRLAPGLLALAAELRERQELDVEEQGARAAPRIQLVVALILVPSVLLVVAAAIVANAESLLAGL